MRPSIINIPSVPQTRFLIVRHPVVHTHFYDVFLKWILDYRPKCSSLFKVRDLPVQISDWTPYSLLIPWLQDPVEQWSVSTYRLSLNLCQECDRRNIPIINRVDRLAQAGKVEAAAVFARFGFRVPKMQVLPVSSDPGSIHLEVPFPCFIRENWGHGGRMVLLSSPKEWERFRLEGWTHPIAVERVDVRNPHDDLYRKYRYIACGDIGLNHHLQVSRDWITRGENRVITDQTRVEELAFLQEANPHHFQFQLIRRAIGLDFLAFDYGYTPAGECVIWEINPFPYIQFSTKQLTYRNFMIHRTLEAMLEMYLRRYTSS